MGGVEIGQLQVREVVSCLRMFEAPLKLSTGVLVFPVYVSCMVMLEATPLYMS